MKSTERVKHWQNFVASVSESTSTQESKHEPREKVLQAKGKFYALHKQELRQQYEIEQALLTPFHPSIISTYKSPEPY